MTATPILGITELPTNPANADAVVNAMIRALENAANAPVGWTVTGDFTATQLQMAAGFMHELGGSPAAAFAFGIYPVARFFGVKNTTGQNCAIYVQGLSGDAVALATGETGLFYCDGANIASVGGGGGGSVAAEDVSYDNAGSGLASANVQDAVSELAVAVAYSGGSSSTRVALAGLSTYTFSGISQLYNHARLTIVGRTDVVALTGDPFVRVNGLSTNIYSVQRFFGQSTATIGEDQALLGSSISPVDFPGTTALAGIMGCLDIEFYEYAGTVEKTGRFTGRQPNSTTTHNCFHMTGGFDIVLAAGITSIEVGLVSGAFIAGSFAILELW